MGTVRGSLPAGASLLLVATADEAWHARLWQRALYPEHTVIVRYEPLRADELKRLRDQYAIHHAVSLGRRVRPTPASAPTRISARCRAGLPACGSASSSRDGPLARARRSASRSPPVSRASARSSCAAVRACSPAWNESLLVGMGACAAALFPLSLILPGRALLATAALLLLASVWVVASRLVRRPAALRSGPQSLDPGDAARARPRRAGRPVLRRAQLSVQLRVGRLSDLGDQGAVALRQGQPDARLVSRRRLRAASRSVSAARPSLRGAR